jgi:NAD(P)-dependent dehydrogenase (short-subunit alcohol dehydrogenase family)
VTKDITGVIIYLASPAGAYVNGKDIAVDGEVRCSTQAVEVVITFKLCDF